MNKMHLHADVCMCHVQAWACMFACVFTFVFKHQCTNLEKGKELIYLVLAFWNLKESNLTVLDMLMSLDSTFTFEPQKQMISIFFTRRGGSRKSIHFILFWGKGCGTSFKEMSSNLAMLSGIIKIRNSRLKKMCLKLSWWQYIFKKKNTLFFNFVLDHSLCCILSLIVSLYTSLFF